MSETEEKKYRQLALFSVIVAEMVVTPTLMGGIFYWLSKGHSFQNLLTSMGALLGLGVAIYRIYLLNRKQNQRDQESRE